MIKNASKGRASIAIMLATLFLAGCLLGILIPLFQRNGVPASVNAMQEQNSEHTEIIKGASRNFTFDIISDHEITNDNLNDFVVVVDSRRNITDVSITDRGDSIYTINPPIGLYAEGDFYTVAITNARFKDERLRENEEITFEISKADVEVVEYKSNVRFIPDSRVIAVEEGRLTILNDRESEYQAGDILMLSDFSNDAFGEVAYKVDDTISNNGNVSILCVVQPTMCEVYEKLEIYGASTATEESLTLYAEEEIQQSIVESESVRAMSYAVAVLNGDINPNAPIAVEKNGWSAGADGSVGIGGFGKKYAPSKINLSMNVKGLSPLQIGGAITVEWIIKDKSPERAVDVALDLKVVLTLMLSISVEDYKNICSERNIYSTGTITSTTVTVSLGLHFSAALDASEMHKRKTLDAMSRLYQKRNRFNPSAAIQSLDPSNSYAPKLRDGAPVFDKNGNQEFVENRINGTYYKDVHTGKYEQNLSDLKLTQWKFNDPETNRYHRDERGRFAAVSDELRASVKKDLLDLSRRYQSQVSNLNTSMIPFGLWVMPTPAGVTITIKLGLVLGVDFKAAFEAKYTYNSVKQQTNITTDSGTVTYDNQYCSHSFSLTLTGKLEFKLGIAAEVKVSFAKIFYVSLQAEGGFYFEVTGTIGLLIGHTDSAEMFVAGNDGGTGGVLHMFNPHTALIGYGRAELGAYFAATLKAGLHINLGIFTIDVSASISYTQKWPFWASDEGDSSSYSDLIFENEIDGDLVDAMKDANNQHRGIKDPLSFDEEFIEQASKKDSRMAITMEKDQFMTKLPRVFRRTIDLNTAQVEYEFIQPNRLRFQNNQAIEMSSDGYICQVDSLNPVIDDIVFITAVDVTGKPYPDREFTFFTVTKEPVPVKSVEISAEGDNDTIFVGDAKNIFAEIEPGYASYKDISFSVVKIIHTGTSITGDETSQFAYFDESAVGSRGRLLTTDRLSIGDTIIIQGKAHNDIESNLIEIKVVRRPVENISFVTQNRQTTVNIGQELGFDLFANPLNATFNLEGSVPEIKIVSEGFAEIIERNGKNYIKVTDDSIALGKRLDLLFIVNDAGEIVELSFSMMIVWMPIDTIRIVDENLNELANVVSLNQGQTKQLIAIAEPLEATILNQIQLLTNVDNEFVSINEFGILQISEFAPIGYQFAVEARYDNLNSKRYRFTVDKIAVEKVNLFVQNGSTIVAPNNQILLRTTIYPSEATFITPIFSIIEGAAFATVANNGLVTIRNNAPIGARIRLQAVADNVTSNIIELNIPATGVFVNAARTSLSIGEMMVLGYDLMPTNNILTPVTFHIVEGNEFANLTLGGTLTINNNVNIPNARIGIVADAYGLTSDVFYINIIVPVASIDLWSDMTSGNMQLGGQIQLRTNINPEFSTHTEVEFIIVENSELARISNGWLIITTNEISDIGEVIGVVARAGGITSDIFRVRLSKIPVMSVEFITEEPEVFGASVNIGSTRRLFATAIPGNATYKDISYRIVSGMEFATINGDMLVVRDTIPLGSIIEIVASADGVDSVENLIVTVVKVDVENVNLVVEKDILTAVPDETVRFSASFYPLNATNQSIRYIIVEGREFAGIDALSGVLTINPVALITSHNPVVGVVAQIDGVLSERIDLQIIVPIINITMQGANIILNPGQSIELTAFPNQFATDKNMVYRFWDNDNRKLLNSSSYAIISDNVLIINTNVFIPNANVFAVAIPADATSTIVSNARRIDIHVPVQTVHLMSSNTAIMLNDSATLNTSIFPNFATDRTVKYEFIDTQGNIVNPPIGVTLLNGIVTVGGYIDIMSLPRFNVNGQVAHIIVRAVVDGVTSNAWAFEITERPVNYITFDDNIKNVINNNGVLEVNPGQRGSVSIGARVNYDATIQGIEFIVTGISSLDITWITRTPILSDGFLRIEFSVPLEATVYNVIKITAVSVRNRNIITQIPLEIHIIPIYAIEIAGVMITSVSDRGEPANLVNGEVPLTDRGIRGVFVNPGDTVTVDNLLFNEDNVTFRHNYSLNYGLNDDRFVVQNNKSFSLLPLDQIVSLIGNDTDSCNDPSCYGACFIVTIRLEQHNQPSLDFSVKFIVFVGVRTVQYLSGTDKAGVSLSMRDGQDLYVNRNAGEEYNVLTFRFGLNNNSFTTNRLLLVNNVVLEEAEGGEFISNASVVSGSSFLANKTVPQLTFSHGRSSGYYNTIEIKFMDWYNVGTVFELKLLNPDNGAGRAVLYRFRIHINPVNTSNSITYGRDGVMNSNGTQIIEQTSSDSRIQSYQVRSAQGPVAISESGDGRNMRNVYADLRVGYAVNLRLGNGIESFGQGWEFIESQSYAPRIIVGRTANDLFYIRMQDTIQDKELDSYRTGRLSKLVFRYEDGNQIMEDIVVWVRIVRILDNDFRVNNTEHTENGVRVDLNIRDKSTDLLLTTRMNGYDWGLNTGTHESHYVPAFEIDNAFRGNGTIRDGRHFDLNMNSAGSIINEVAIIYYNIKQFYNGQEIAIRAGVRDREDSLKRRFVVNAEQFIGIGIFQGFGIGSYSNTDGTIKLLSDINFSHYGNPQAGDLNGFLDGNGHRITNLSFHQDKTKLSSDRSLGLFTTIYGGASNLKIENVNLSTGVRHNGSWFFFGSLAAINKGIIKNVEIASGHIEVHREDSRSGGIVGINENIIENSINRANWRGNGDYGGIAGSNSGTIRSSRNFGSISYYHRKAVSIGGVIGWNSGTAAGLNSFGKITSENTVTNKTRIGGIIGHNTGSYDGLGSRGSWDLTYRHIFKDNSEFMFSFYEGRVGKQG